MKHRSENRRGIMIVGGYGAVGSAIVRALAPCYPGRIVAAGRSAKRAVATAEAIGSATRGRAVDITRPPDEALDDIGLVVMCVDQPDTVWLEACVAQGIHYIDVTANATWMRKARELRPMASQNGSSVVLGVGLAPGLTNLLVTHLSHRLHPAKTADIYLMLGLGDSHGPMAIAWTLGQLNQSFELQHRSVRTFEEGSVFQAPDSGRERKAYRFGFPEQHMLVESGSLEFASNYLCFDSALVTWWAHLLVRWRLVRWLRISWIARAARALLANWSFGSDAWSVVAHVRGHVDDGPIELRAALTGRKEAATTADVATAVARRMLERPLPAGVHYLDEVMTLEETLPTLAGKVEFLEPGTLPLT